MHPQTDPACAQSFPHCPVVFPAGFQHGERYGEKEAGKGAFIWVNTAAGGVTTGSTEHKHGVLLDATATSRRPHYRFASVSRFLYISQTASFFALTKQKRVTFSGRKSVHFPTNGLVVKCGLCESETPNHCTNCSRHQQRSFCLFVAGSTWQQVSTSFSEAPGPVQSIKSGSSKNNNGSGC